MDNNIMVNIETVNGENVAFTIPKKDIGFPDFGFMYTVKRATNPNEERSIIIPWGQIKRIIVDEDLKGLEDEDDGK